MLTQWFLVEAAYLIDHDVGIPIVIKWLKGIPDSRFELIEATSQDIERIAQILEQYADSKVNFVDASAMAIAERLDISTILTIERRDFSIFRLRYCLNYRTLCCYPESPQGLS